MENLKITIVQPDIIWEDIQANLEKYSKLFENVKETNLLVFPEMFTTGFSMNTEALKETMEGTSVQWMKNCAKQKNAAVVGSLIIDEAGNTFNRALWVFPNGSIKYYDKHHLFTPGKENQNYLQGNEKLVVEYEGWKICPMICYDLRFPVWSRNVENYDVLIYMANWPSARHHHWKSLLVARAIENQAYCIGVNRTGRDGTGLNYSGDSVFVSHEGFAEFAGEKECIISTEISRSKLHEYREKLPFLADQDKFSIEV